MRIIFYLRSFREKKIFLILIFNIFFTLVQILKFSLQNRVIFICQVTEVFRKLRRVCTGSFTYPSVCI